MSLCHKLKFSNPCLKDLQTFFISKEIIDITKDSGIFGKDSIPLQTKCYFFYHFNRKSKESISGEAYYHILKKI